MRSFLFISLAVATVVSQVSAIPMGFESREYSELDARDNFDTIFTHFRNNLEIIIRGLTNGQFRISNTLSDRFADSGQGGIL